MAMATDLPLTVLAEGGVSDWGSVKGVVVSRRALYTCGRVRRRRLTVDLKSLVTLLNHGGGVPVA